MGMKLLYRPFGLVLSVAGGLIASLAFDQVWKRLSGEDEAPAATDPDYSWREVLLAATLQGALFGLVKATINRGGAKGYQRLTGVYPDD
jgi:hypothetical protein